MSCRWCTIMDRPRCPCLEERALSATAALNALTDPTGTFLFGAKNVDLRQVLSMKHLALLHRIRTADIEERSASDKDEDVDPEFSQGWNLSDQEEKQDVPLLRGSKLDRHEQSRSNQLREKLVSDILDIREDKFHNLSRDDAIARSEAKKMVRDYYWSDKCLQCADLVDRARTDIGNKRQLKQIVALFIEAGTQVPFRLRNWATCSFLANPSQQHYGSTREPNRPNVNWNRNQRIGFATYVLVCWTESSQYAAFRIVSKVWNSKKSDTQSADDVRKVWKCYRKLYEYNPLARLLTVARQRTQLSGDCRLRTLGNS